MIGLALEFVIAPALVGGSTLACRRWGERVGGLLSAFPAVVGPVLLITAHERGAAFTARTAVGTLLGLVALAGFALAYGRVALGAGWRVSLLAGWICAALLAALLELAGTRVGLLMAVVGAVLGLSVAYRAMPSLVSEGGDRVGDEIWLRITLTAVLVMALAGAVELLGPLVGGMLAGLPVLASVLAVFTHRRFGAAALVVLLRGMLTGMAGFVGFCAVVAFLIVPTGTAPAFVLATATAVTLQALALKGGWSKNQRTPTVSRRERAARGRSSSRPDVLFVQRRV